MRLHFVQSVALCLMNRHVSSLKNAFWNFMLIIQKHKMKKHSKDAPIFFFPSTFYFQKLVCYSCHRILCFRIRHPTVIETCNPYWESRETKRLRYCYANISLNMNNCLNGLRDLTLLSVFETRIVFGNDICLGKNFHALSKWTAKWCKNY